MSSWPPVDGGGGGGAPTTATYATSADETATLPNSKRVGTFWLLPPGTLGARPGAGTVGAGAIYNATDVGIVYRSDGVATWTALTITQSGALLSANNLSDLANAATARANLGALAIANNLTDVANRQTALNNLSGGVTNHAVLAGDGTNVTLRALTNADLPAVVSGGVSAFSKMIIAGHSYNMIVQNVIGAGYNPNGFFTNGGSLVDRGQWPCMIQDIFGIGSDRKYIAVSLQQTGATADYEVDVPVGEDCWVEAASYFPNAAIATGGAAASRQWTIAVPTGPSSGAWQTVGIVTQTTGDLGAAARSAGVEMPILDICEVTTNVLGNQANQAFRSSSAASTNFTQFTTNHTIVPGGQAIQIKSTHLGATGRADPGGVMVIRVGGRFRNYSVGGASHVQSGIYRGGWATSMNPVWNPRAVLPQNSAPPINLTAKFPSTQATVAGTINTTPSTVTVSSTADFAASGTFSLWTNGGAVTVTYTGGGGGGTTFTGCTIAAGSQTYAIGNQACGVTASFEAVIFGSLGGFLIAPNGTVASATAFISFGATSISTAATSPAQGGDHGSVAIGQQAQFIAQAPTLGWETPTGHGLAILLTGINDCGSTAGFDIIGLREAYRAWAAFHACSGFYSVNPITGNFGANVVTTNGTGTWAQRIAPAFGQHGGGVLSFTGTPNASSKIVISLGPGFRGGPIDLFFLAWAGTNDGGTASITVDGATPPQGAVTVCTTGACPTASSNILTGTVTSGGGPFAFGGFSGGSRDFVGMKMKGTPFTNGSIVTAGDGTTTGYTSTPACAATGGAACTAYGLVPMVKRLTGVPAGAHTIEITVTGMFSTAGDAEFMFYGYGLEPTTTLLNPVVLCNVPQILGTYFGFNPNPNAQTLNTEIPKIINGTATAVAGNTTEPALSAFTVMADLDAAINQGAALFSNDGLHPNTLGHAVIADAILSKIKATVTQLQSFAR